MNNRGNGVGGKLRNLMSVKLQPFPLILNDNPAAEKRMRMIASFIIKCYCSASLGFAEPCVFGNSPTPLKNENSI